MVRSIFVLTAIAGFTLMAGPPPAVRNSGSEAGGLATSVTPARNVTVEPSYKIGPGDVLSVYIWREPEASSASVKVRADGIVTLRLIGELHVGEATLHDVQLELIKRYSAYLLDPVITLNIEETNSQVIYLVGEIKKSGALHFVAPMNVLQAIAEAGGLSDFARRNRIYILRDNARTKLLFDYDAVVRGRKPEQNIILQRGDTVVIPR